MLYTKIGVRNHVPAFWIAMAGQLARLPDQLSRAPIGSRPRRALETQGGPQTGAHRALEAPRLRSGRSAQHGGNLLEAKHISWLAAAVEPDPTVGHGSPSGRADQLPR